MIYRRLAPVGKPMSTMFMGSTAFGMPEMPDEMVCAVLDAFRALGGNCIDTARVYGDFARMIPGIAEASIGRWLKKQPDREALVIGTKGGHPRLDSMHTGRLDRASVHGDMLKSLEVLGLDYVDIYWLHRDDESRPVGEILETLNALVEAGQTHALGASNWSPARIREANAYAAAHGLMGFCANQPQWSLARMAIVEDDTLRGMDAETYAMHKETGLACIPYSSQAKGFFTKLFTLGEAGLGDKARRRFLTEGNLQIYEALLHLREETGHGVGALALAYLASQPFPVFPIVGVSRLAQVEDLREAGDCRLTEAQLKTLARAAGM